MKADFYTKIEEITEKDPRYKPDAYEFVMRALFFTQKKLKIKAHVSGKELSQGIKELCFHEFGPMSKTVLGHWGIKNTRDFGEIVFNMVNSGLMSKTDDDSVKDFENIFDFNDAFVNEYRAHLDRELKQDKPAK